MPMRQWWHLAIRMQPLSTWLRAGTPLAASIIPLPQVSQSLKTPWGRIATSHQPCSESGQVKQLQPCITHSAGKSILQFVEHIQQSIKQTLMHVKSPQIQWEFCSDWKILVSFHWMKSGPFPVCGNFAIEFHWCWEGTPGRVRSILQQHGGKHAFNHTIWGLTQH